MPYPAPESDPCASVSDLSLAYPGHSGSRAFQAVAGITFDVRRGEVVALLGESGSGKSTLAKFLAGRGDEAGEKSARIKLVGGSATVMGTPMKRLSRRTRSRLTAYTGFLSQEAGATLAPELNVGDILMEPIEERSKRFDREAVGERIAEMMDLVSLPLAKLQEYPYELSKGQRQRVAVMRSLMLDPAFLIADEPTLGVDANNRPRIVNLLKWYRERTGASMMVISHDIGVLEALAQEVIVLQQGQMVGRGDINDIFRLADHGYVQQLAQALRANAYDEIADE